MVPNIVENTKETAGFNLFFFNRIINKCTRDIPRRNSSLTTLKDNNITTGYSNFKITSLAISSSMSRYRLNALEFSTWPEILAIRLGSFNSR